MQRPWQSLQMERSPADFLQQAGHLVHFDVDNGSPWKHGGRLWFVDHQMLDSVLGQGCALFLGDKEVWENIMDTGFFVGYLLDFEDGGLVAHRDCGNASALPKDGVHCRIESADTGLDGTGEMHNIAERKLVLASVVEVYVEGRNGIALFAQEVLLVCAEVPSNRSVEGIDRLW